jgi:hypothetical protein
VQEYYFEVFRYKYDFATKALALNSMRNNVLFMVGSVLCLLGTMIVVRKLREPVEVGANNGGVSFTLKTSSLGVYLVLIGFLMLITPVLIKDHYAITEGGTEMRTEPNFDNNSSLPSDNEQLPGIGPE